MAKSKSGGTRSYLRGRIASDVYSIGRDASGKKQQVVRSLAEQVKNPQTISQMRGRMIMSTVMQAVSAMSQIIDHSFDNVPNGQPSISEFIRRNYALLKADVAANLGGDSKFAYSPYQAKGIRGGEYILSDGKAVIPAVVVYPSSTRSGLIELNVGAAATTAKAIRDAIGMAEDDFLTLVTFDSFNGANFFRVNVSFALADDTAITADNVAQLFTIDNPLGLEMSVTFNSGTIMIGAFNNIGAASGVIFSKAVDGGFEHSKSVCFYSGADVETPNSALATYPVGEERFLNGGEL